MRSQLLKQVLLIALVSVALVYGQSGVGKITGVITDSSGLPVVAATVETHNVETGETWRTTTNSAGVYVAAPLPSGVYTLTVRQQGFRTVTRNDIRIEVNSAPAIDIQLQVGAVTESITVESGALLINTENQSIGDSRFAMQLENQPIFVREVAEVVGQTSGVPYGTQSTVGGTYEYNGGRSAMAVISDGAQVNPQQTESWPSIGGIGRRADLTIPGVDVISEVKFVTSGADAQYMQPVQVIISSKNGTNELHGSGFEYYASGGLGARIWEAATRGSFVRHQFGGTVGGPIKKDKMFFFAGVDGFRYSLQNILNGRVPTAAEKSGNLGDELLRTTSSGSPAPVSLYDPLNKGQLFPNNVIPASRIDPISIYLMNLIPSAPLPPGRVTDFNTVYDKPQFDNSDRYDFRYDYNISSRDRLFARTTVSGLNQMVAYLGDVPGLNYGYSGKHERTEAIVGNWTRSVNPSTVTVFEFSFRSMPFKIAPSIEGNTVFPIPIVNVNPKPPLAGPPSVVIGSNALTMDDCYDRKMFNYSADYGYTFDPSVSKIIGNHVLKAGFDFSRGYKTQELASAPYGKFSTASDFNNANSTTSATGDAFADFLLGLPSSTAVTIGPAGGWLSKTNFDFWAQDNWKVTSRLTVNFGLRYDHLGFFEEMNKRQSAFDIQTGKVVLPNNSQTLIQPAFLPFQSQFETAADEGVPDTLIKPNNRDFDPRVGAAYRITPTFVARGGFGIYDVDINSMAGINQPPFIYNASLSRSLLLSQGVAVNSLFTFENPTANGSTAAATSALSGISGAQDAFPTQKAYEWNFSLEKDMGHQMVIRSSYTGNLGRHLSRTVQLNGCVPGPTQCLSRAATDPTGRKWTGFGMSTDNGAANGQSEFNSVDVEFQKRFVRGLLFTVNYAYARLFAYVDASDPISNPMSKHDWGLVSANQLTGSASMGQPDQVFHWNYVYEIPMGKGHRVGDSMGKIGEALLGHWKIAGLGTWESGDHLTITTSLGQSPTGANTNRADQIASAALPAGKQSTYLWFNTAAFVQPAKVNASAPNPTYQFGSSGIGAVTGPRRFFYDMSLQKAIPVPLGERRHLWARVDCYNPLNHPVLGDPITDVNNSNFGRIQTSLGNGNGSGYQPRSIQLSLKLEF